MKKSSYIINKDTGCWEWQGACSSSGYGHISMMGKSLMVHKLSYKLFKGNIYKPKFVCHTCDNKKCFNPEHLFLGTAKENYDDMVKKGRARFQKKRLNYPGIKLTKDKVLEIKSLINEGKYYYKEIASMYNVSAETVRQIASGERWSDV